MKKNSTFLEIFIIECKNSNAVVSEKSCVWILFILVLMVLAVCGHFESYFYSLLVWVRDIATMRQSPEPELITLLIGNGDRPRYFQESTDLFIQT